MKPKTVIESSFIDDLAQLENMIAEMGGMAELQLADAVDALIRRDSDAAKRVVQNDATIDEIEAKIDDLSIALLRHHSPEEQDLRAIITGLRTASIIERIGDYAKNIAKRSIVLSQNAPMGPSKSISRMAVLVQGMIKNVLDAYISRDSPKAEDVRRSDAEVDLLHTSLFREILTEMTEDPNNITSCTHLLFIAKNLERIGDHATNVAENVYFLVEGHQPEDEREKDDGTSYIVVDL